MREREKERKRKRQTDRQTERGVGGIRLIMGVVEQEKYDFPTTTRSYENFCRKEIGSRN